jgi:hypothetical protein
MSHFASFGIKMTLEKAANPAVLQIQNKKYLTQRDIKDMTFQVSEHGYLYTVRFDMLRPS